VYQQQFRLFLICRLAAEQIASATGKDIEEVKVIIAVKKTELA
jgi:hypothetical protein